MALTTQRNKQNIYNWVGGNVFLLVSTWDSRESQAEQQYNTSYQVTVNNSVVVCEELLLDIRSQQLGEKHTKNYG